MDDVPEYVEISCTAFGRLEDRAARGADRRIISTAEEAELLQAAGEWLSAAGDLLLTARHTDADTKEPASTDLFRATMALAAVARQLHGFADWLSREAEQYNVPAVGDILPDAEARYAVTLRRLRAA